MPFRARELRCPDCKESLATIRLQGHRADRCDRCQGIWFEPAAFFSLCLEHRPEAVPELMVHNDGTPKRACPACAEDMEIAWMDFLQLDQCESHGIWLDDGELKRALDGDTGAEQIERIVKVAEHMRKQREAEQKKRGNTSTG